MTQIGEWGGAFYDHEVQGYDDTRGGTARARAAAEAIASLVPAGGQVLDIAGGTGIVSAELAAQGRSLLVADASAGMLAEARQRLPGRVVQALGDRLPLRADTVDLVTIIWMLNLVPAAVVDAILADAARVLRPGGHLVITVDKELAHARSRASDNDADERVSAVLADLGLDRAGTTTFAGHSRHWGSPDGADPVFTLAAFRRAEPARG